MANEQNLHPCEYKLTQEEAKKGGIASGKARAAKRDLRRAIEILLEKDYKSKDGTMLTGTEAIALAQMKKALNGDAKAFELLRDTAGQKPVERIMLAEVDEETIAEVERAFLGGEDNDKG